MPHVTKTAGNDSLCPSCPILASITPPIQRETAPLSLDEFCATLETGEYEWEKRVGRLHIINLPRAILVNDGGQCHVVRIKGTNLDAFFAEQLAAIDQADIRRVA